MINVAIYGYGNLGRGVEDAIARSGDMRLVAVFTRRDPADLTLATEGAKAVHADEILQWKDKVDVLFLCGGSATDLPTQTPELAAHFNVVDSYDNHSRIPQHYAAVDAAASAAGTTALISCGWDPGMFSLNRLYAGSILPDGSAYTFWGKGVSQGHSDAIRRIEGVVDARQYTVPVAEAMDRVRSGETPEFTTREKHRRECYVVAEEGADLDRIEREIKTMPNYFADYETSVTFITKEELMRDHAGIPHGGSVIRTGVTGLNGEHKHVIEYSLKLDSNPEFTASVLVAYARAAYKLNKSGECGCKTVFDIPPALLSKESPEDLRKRLL
jgi:diaminopimelate dehydrogenase